MDFLSSFIVYCCVLPVSAIAVTFTSTSSWSFTDMLFIDICGFPSVSPDFKVVYWLFASIDRLTCSVSADIYSLYVCVSESYFVTTFSPFFISFIDTSSDIMLISSTFVIAGVSPSCACILMFNVIFLFPSLKVSVFVAGVCFHSVPSPICIFACASVAVISISVSCVSLPLSYTVAIYFPSVSDIILLSTFTVFMLVSVDFFTTLIWYIAFSPFSAVTIVSTSVVSLAISTVFASAFSFVSPAISTVASSLVALTSIVASVSVLSIYFT